MMAITAAFSALTCRLCVAVLQEETAELLLERGREAAKAHGGPENRLGNGSGFKGFQGYRDRYYASKLSNGGGGGGPGDEGDTAAARRRMVAEYTRGLCWVLECVRVLASGRALFFCVVSWRHFVICG